MGKRNLSQTGMLRMVLADLGRWSSQGDSDCSMAYAHRNGYQLHAANLWLGTGAATESVVEAAKELVINLEDEKKEVEEILEHAHIYTCPDCNHHAFLDEDDGDAIQCSSCLKTAFKYIEEENWK